MFKFWGIRKNILFLVLMPSILVSLVMSSYFVIDRIETLETTQLAKGKMFLSSLSLIAQAYSLDESILIQRQLLKFRDSDRDILAIAILNSKNDLIVQAGNDAFMESAKITHFTEQFDVSNYETYLHITAPISLLESKETYYVSILIDRQPLILESYHAIFMASIIALTVLSLSLIIALHLSKTIGIPLQKISDDLESINNGELDIIIDTPNIPELARISSTINSLTDSLQQARDNMQHNVDQATSDLTQTLETIEIQNVELDMARKQAIQASRVKSEFLANISHEIRTPMNGVIGFTNLLLNSELDTTQKDYLLTIKKSANNLLGIIEDILDFSKIEAGKMTLDKVSFSLRDCVEEVITMLSPSSVKKDIELIPLIYKNVPEQLLGDPIRIKQILTNLISNAIKFTEKGSIVVRVLLENEYNDIHSIRTTITDTGIGMTDEQIHKLFQPFSQVNQSINRHHSGTGLGLVISKKLVEQMGGEITVESKSNEGTSFSYTIISERISEDLQQHQHKPSICLSEQPVLVFDPHPMALLAIKQLLSSWDMEVYDFQNIDKLLLKMEQLKANAIKPVVMLGLSKEVRHLADKISTLSQNKCKALIILGNSSEQHEIEKFVDAGTSQYLEKPLTRKQLKKSFEEIGMISKITPLKKDTIEKNNHFSQLRILTVDDNPSNLKLITIILEEMTIDVIQAYDGLSAVEISKEEKFDLIIMDIRMPGLDGIEASQRIKKDSLNERTPIIALTAHAMAGEKEQLLTNGLEDYMTKPVNTLQLQQIISKWTGQIAEPIKEIAVKDYKTNSDSIDWAACLNISGGREKLAKEMLGDLITAIPDFQQLLNDDSMDESELLTNVHKLHGLACYTGVPEIQKITHELEKEIKTKASEKQINNLRTLLVSELSIVEKDASSFLQ